MTVTIIYQAQIVIHAVALVRHVKMNKANIGMAVNAELAQIPDAIIVHLLLIVGRVKQALY